MSTNILTQAGQKLEADQHFPIRSTKETQVVIPYFNVSSFNVLSITNQNKQRIEFTRTIFNTTKPNVDHELQVSSLEDYRKVADWVLTDSVDTEANKDLKKEAITKAKKIEPIVLKKRITVNHITFPFTGLDRIRIHPHSSAILWYSDGLHQKPTWHIKKPVKSEVIGALFEVTPLLKELITIVADYYKPWAYAYVLDTDIALPPFGENILFVVHLE